MKTFIDSYDIDNSLVWRIGLRVIKEMQSLPPPIISEK
jgi:hypothetical protein